MEARSPRRKGIRPLKYLVFVIVGCALSLSLGVEAFEEWAFYNGKQSYGQLYSELTRTRANNNRIDGLVFATYSLSKAGTSIVGSAEPTGEAFAKKLNITRFMGLDNLDVVNGYYDAVRASKALKSRNSQRLIPQIINIIAKNEYAGLLIDLENLPKNQRSTYSSFIQRLYVALKTKGKNLIVSVPAMSVNSPTSNTLGAYDYAALGNASDKLFIMTWDQVTSYPGGPVASLPWVKSAVVFAKSMFPTNKLLAGIPTYGYQYGVSFPSQKVMVLSWFDIQQKLAAGNVVSVVTKLNGNMISPSSDYKLSYPNDNYVENVIWYENAASLQAKISYAKSENLPGVIVYALGIDSPYAWDAIML